MSNIHYMITRSKIKNENSSNNTGNTDDDSDDEDYEPYKHVSKKQKRVFLYTWKCPKKLIKNPF